MNNFVYHDTFPLCTRSIISVVCYVHNKEANTPKLDALFGEKQSCADCEQEPVKRFGLACECDVRLLGQHP
ncbi:MAG: hypothetical protein ABGW78_03085 [Pirellulales bacterium]